MTDNTRLAAAADRAEILQVAMTSLCCRDTGDCPLDDICASDSCTPGSTPSDVSPGSTISTNASAAICWASASRRVT